MLELKMLQNESFPEFVVRVLNDSDNKQETYKYLFDKELAKDECRKRSYLAQDIQNAVEQGRDKLFVSDIDVVEIPKSEELNGFYKSEDMIEVEDKELLLNKIKRLEKQLISTKDNLRIARADNTKEYRTETIWEKFLKDFNNINPIDIANPIIKDYDSIAILNLADVHSGMKFENELNIYNKEVMKQRFTTLTNKTIAKLTPNTKLIVLQLGDAVSGNIHISTRINSDMNVVESTKAFTECVLGMLVKLCESFACVEYHSVHGNHCRITPSKEESLEKENFIAFSDWYIRESMKNVSNFYFPNNRFFGISEIDVFGEKIVGLHGHQATFDSVTKIVHTVGYIPKQVNMGHLHLMHTKDFGRTRVVCNPSFCGIDSYASDKLLYGKPHQLLEVFYENGDKETKELYL